VSLDLGATAKALAADHAAAAAAAATGGGVLVSLGGDIATAGPAPEGAWRVRVTCDHRGGVEAPGQWITIDSGGLATSSTAVRRLALGREHGASSARPRDRATGRMGLADVSVAAATCLDANIASTAAVIRGERAPAWLESLRLPSRPGQRRRPGLPPRRLAYRRGRPDAGGRRGRGDRMSALATIGPSAYWYLARGTGAVALVLLTASVVIGILDRCGCPPSAGRGSPSTTVHRDVSLLVIVL